MRKKKMILAVCCALLFFSVGTLGSFLKTSLEVRNYSEVDTEGEWEEFRALHMEESFLQTCHRQRNMPWYPLLFKRNREDRGGAALESLLADLECFPVKGDRKGGETVSFEDSWGGARTYGGERRHEGTDIMPSNDVRGYFPVVSVSDGVIEKKGWLKLGGWRLGIRAPHGAYFYYAHLDHYAGDLEEGSRVRAGQIIGYMGDSGYGEEGTVGQFAVHLHFGVYLDVEGEEVSVNPYPLLRLVE